MAISTQDYIQRLVNEYFRDPPTMHIYRDIYMHWEILTTFHGSFIDDAVDWHPAVPTGYIVGCDVAKGQ